MDLQWKIFEVLLVTIKNKIKWKAISFCYPQNQWLLYHQDYVEEPVGL
jgi:hypothetical protein